MDKVWKVLTRLVAGCKSLFGGASRHKVKVTASRQHPETERPGDQPLQCAAAAAGDFTLLFLRSCALGVLWLNGVCLFRGLDLPPNVDSSPWDMAVEQTLHSPSR
jgi:hypothetical protein